MIYGYARVSTDAQSLDLQINALKDCDIIFTEKISAVKKKRPEFEKMMYLLKRGDTVIVYKLDRLGRSVVELFNIMEKLFNKEVEFISITDKIDTKTAMGQLVFTILAGFAEFERNLISERTKAGLKAIQQKGITLGPPTKYTQDDIKKASKLKKQKYKTREIANIMHIPVRSVNYLLSKSKPFKI